MDIQYNSNGFSLSIGSYQELITTAETKASFVGSSAELDKEGWAGTETYEQALILLKEGTPEANINLVDMDYLSPKFNAAPTINSFSQAEEGVMFDVGAMLSGEPEHWMTPVIDYEFRSQSVIWLRINCGASSDIKPKYIVNRGVALCSMINALQAQGFKVGIQIDKTFTNKQYGNHINILLKQPDEPLSFNHLYFCLVSPAFNRRIIFRLCELIGKQQFNEYVGTGYGTTIDNVLQGLWAIPSILRYTYKFHSLDSSLSHFSELMENNFNQPNNNQ